MKRFLLVIVLFVVLSGAVFASDVHPDGLGIGVLWGGNFGWNGWGFGQNIGLSLKIPSVPVFLGIFFGGIGSDGFSVGFQGDIYFLGSEIVPTFGWFLGAGIYASIWHFSPDEDTSLSSLDFGVRLPIGLTFQPIDLLEVFFNLAPSLGTGVSLGRKNEIKGLGGGLGAELGLRLWF